MRKKRMASGFWRLICKYCARTGLCCCGCSFRYSSNNTSSFSSPSPDLRQQAPDEMRPGLRFVLLRFYRPLNCCGFRWFLPFPLGRWHAHGRRRFFSSRNISCNKGIYRPGRFLLVLRPFRSVRFVISLLYDRDLSGSGVFSNLCFSNIRACDFFSRKRVCDSREFLYERLSALLTPIFDTDRFFVMCEFLQSGFFALRVGMFAGEHFLHRRKFLESRLLLARR